MPTEVEKRKSDFLNSRDDVTYREAVDGFLSNRSQQLWDNAQPDSNLSAGTGEQKNLEPQQPGLPAQPQPAQQPAQPQQPADGAVGGAAPQQPAQPGEQRGVGADVALQTVGGIRDAVQEGLDSFNELSDYLESRYPALGGGVTIGGPDIISFESPESRKAKLESGEIFDPFKIPLPQVDKPSTTAGGLTRGVSQFLTAFLPIFKAMKGSKALSAAQTARRAVGAAAITDFTFFDPHEERLSNFINENEYLRNPVTEYLQANPYDSSVEGRMKNVLEGFGLDLALSGAFMAALKGYRAARKTRNAPVSELDTVALEQQKDPIQEAAENIQQKPPTALTKEEFHAVNPEGDYLSVLTDALATGKPIAQQTTETADFKSLVEGLKNPDKASDITRESMKAQGLVEEVAEDVPEGFQAFVDLAGKVETGKEFVEQARNIKGVSPETADWYRKRFGADDADMAVASQRFLDEVKAGKFPKTTLNITERGARVKSGSLSPTIYTEKTKVKLEPPTEPRKVFGDPDRSLIQRSTPAEVRNSSEAGGASSTSPTGSPDGVQSVPSQTTASPPPSSVFATATTRPSSLPGGISETSSRGINVSPTVDKVYHDFDDPVKLFSEAQKALPDLEKHLKWAISDIPGAKFIGARVKDQAKALDKITKKGLNPAQMSDYVGARVSVQTKDELDALLKKLGDGSDIIEIEDFTGAPKAGYRAVHVQIKGKNGVSSEVQILPEPIARVQDEAHALYERFRRPEMSKLSAEDLAEAVNAKKQSEEIFDKAWREWEANNSPVTDEVLNGMIRIDAPAGNRAININLARIQGSDDIKEVIAETAEFYKKDINEARRGVQTNEATKELADQLGMDVDVLLARQQGQAFNAEQAVAARNLLVASADKLTQMATGIRNQGASPDELFAFRKMIETHRAIQMQVSGMTAEAGRALQSFNIQAKSRRQQLRAIDEILERTGGIDIHRGIADSLAKLAEEGASNAKISQTASRMAEVTSLDTLLTLRQAAMLSSYKTHLVNIVSNAITMSSAIPERFLAGGISALRGDEAVKVQEGVALMRGMVSGVWDAINISGRAFRDNVEIDFASKTPEVRLRTITAANLADNTIGKGIGGISRLAGGKALGEGGFVDHLVNGLGTVVDLPFRGLNAEDAFFKSMNAQMELHALSYRRASQEGLKGAQLRDRVAELLSNPPEDMVEEAIQFSRVQTFTNPNRFAAATTAQLQNIKIARFVVPFVRTPANLVKYSLDRTPIAPLMHSVREDIKAGGARRALAEARIAMGSTVLMAAGTLASQGAITGAPPRDPQLRQIWMQEYQPYSININHGTGKPAEWRSYNRLDPWGSVLGMGADLWNTAAIADESTTGEMTAMAVISLSNQVLNKTWMTGLSDFMEAVNEPERRGGKYIDYMLQSFVPALSRQLNYDFNDPVIRDFDTTWQGMMTRIPGYSDSLPAKRDIWGGMRMYQGGGMMQKMQTEDDPINQLLIRRQIPVGMPDRSISISNTRVKLTAEEYSRFVELARQPAKQELDLLAPNLEGIEGIGTGSPLDNAVKSILRAHAARARLQLINEFPEIQDRALIQHEEQSLIAD